MKSAKQRFFLRSASFCSLVLLLFQHVTVVTYGRLLRNFVANVIEPRNMCITQFKSGESEMNIYSILYI